MKKTIFFYFFFCLIISCSKDSETDAISEDVSKNSLIVGYLPTWRFDLNKQIDYCKLTHLNIAFANPDANGKIIMPDISSIVSEAKNNNPNIITCISLAGGVLTNAQANNWKKLIDNPGNVPGFVSNIVQFELYRFVYLHITC